MMEKKIIRFVLLLIILNESNRCIDSKPLWHQLLQGYHQPLILQEVQESLTMSLFSIQLMFTMKQKINYSEKEKVGSAINNRKDGHSLGGTWTETLDRIMSSKDSHAAKMDPSRVSPNSTDVLPELHL